MKWNWFLIFLLLALFGCNKKKKGWPVELNPQLILMVFDLDTESKGLRATVKWNKVPGNDGNLFKYRILLNGDDIGESVYTNVYELPVLLEQSTAYRVTVVAEDLIEEITFQTPSWEDEKELDFEMTPSYTGFTAINVHFTSLDPNFKNKVYWNGEILREDFDGEELLISDLPLSEVTSSFSTAYQLDVYAMKTDILGAKSSTKVFTEQYKKLPEKDLVMQVYNIQHNSVDFNAKNISTDPLYSESYNPSGKYKVYVNDEYIGKYGCEWDGSFVNESFPTLDNLQPGTVYTLRVEFDFHNVELNSIYEPDLDMELTTSIEEQVVTLDGPPVTNLDVEVSSITNSGFDLSWRTDLSKLISCDPFGNIYQFELELNGVRFREFDAYENPVKIEGLQSNTLYNAKLICKKGNLYFNTDTNFIETRTASFEIQTLY